MSDKKLNPFDVLFAMNKGQLFTKEEVKDSGLSSFILIHFIKAHPILINVALYLNKNYRMDIYDMYLFVFLTFKRFNIKNVRWIKSEKMNKPEDIDVVMRYYSVGYKIANQYLDALPKKKIKEIKEYYDVGGARK